MGIAASSDIPKGVSGIRLDLSILEISSSHSVYDQQASRYVTKIASAWADIDKGAEPLIAGCDRICTKVTRSELEDINVTLLGASSVGKTALLSQLVFMRLPPEDDETTTGENVVYTLDHRQGSIYSHFPDTSASVWFSTLKNIYIDGSSMFIVVYSLDDVDSFEDAGMIVRDIKEHCCCRGNVPIILVGNKLDIPEEQKELSIAVADLLAIDWDVTSHVFTSATRYKDSRDLLDIVLRHTNLQTHTTRSRTMDSGRRNRSIRRRLSEVWSKGRFPYMRMRDAV